MNKLSALIFSLFFTTIGCAQIQYRFVPPDDGFVEVEELIIDKISEDSLKLLIDKGEKGDTMTQVYLGDLYDIGWQIEQDFIKAKYWFNKAAILGNAYASFSLGFMYENEHGVTKDYTKAKYWYEKAANLGQSDAMFSLGSMYYDGNGVTKDYSKAKYWYEKAANLGDVDAMFSLGSMYDDGKGIAKDYTKAKYWYVKATNLGHNDAMNNLGLLYQNGQGISKDYIKAKEWFEKSAELKNKYAFYNLGELYRQGYGVKVNEEIAKDWYEKAADLEHDISMNKLGVLYQNDNQFNTAKYWFEKAIEYNNVDAMANLGMLYEFGQGVDKNLYTAQEWYRKAMDNGHPYIGFRLNFVQNELYGVFNGINFMRRKELVKEYSYTDYSNGWIYLTETKNDIRFFKEVSKDGYSDIKVWVKSIPKSNQLAGYRNENSSLFKSATIKQKVATQLSSYKSLYILNCKGNKLGEKSSVYYTKDGSVIYTDNNELFNSYDMSEVIPETIGEDILNTICEYYEKYGK